MSGASSKAAVMIDEEVPEAVSGLESRSAHQRASGEGWGTRAGRETRTARLTVSVAQIEIARTAAASPMTERPTVESLGRLGVRKRGDGQQPVELVWPTVNNIAIETKMSAPVFRCMTPPSICASFQAPESSTQALQMEQV
jgi:hypothetical protein